MTWAAYTLIQSREQERVLAGFNRYVDSSANLLQARTDNLVEVFHTFRKFFRAKQEITHADFHALAAHELNCLPGLTILAWVPAPPGAAQTDSEVQTKAEGSEGLPSGEPSLAGQPATAAPNTGPLTVRYLRGPNLPGMEVGADLSLLPETSEFLQKARKIEWIAASAPYLLPGNTNGARAVTLAAPAYWVDRRQGTNAPNLKRFQGYFIGVLRVDQFVDARFDQFQSGGLDFLMLDKSAPEGSQFLHFYDPTMDPSIRRSLSVEFAPSERAMGAGIHRELNIRLGYQHWTVLFRPRVGLLPPSKSGPLIWAVGLFCTVVATLHLYYLARRAEIVERLVRERTATLNQTQAQLQEEVQRLNDTQTQLRQRERELHHAQEIAGLAITRWDRLGEQLHVSDLAWKICGRPPEPGGCTLDRFIDWTPPEERPRLRALRDQTRSGIAVPPFEFRICRPDGSERLVRGVADFMRDAEGQITSILCTFLDITESKQIEANLRRQQEEFATIFNLVPAGILYKDSNRRIVRANQAAAEIIGLPIQSIEGRTIGELGLAGADVVDQDDLDVLSSGQPKWGLIQPLQNASGRQVWLAKDKLPLRNQEGRLVGLLVFGQDITRRFEAEEALKKRHAELSILNTIAAELNKSLVTGQVLAALQTGLHRHLGVSGGAIATYGADPRGELTLNMVWGVDAGKVGELYRDFRTRAAQEPTPAASAGKDPGPNATTDGRLCVPLLAHGEKIGMIEILRHEPGTDPDFSRGFFHALGMTAGVALQHARLFEETLEGRERLRELSRQLVAVQESERRHLARELHDHIGQLLSALSLAIEAERATEACPRTDAILADLINRVRSMSLNLRPAILDDLGLVPAVLWLIDHYPESGPTIHLEHTGVDRRFPALLETAAFRVVQEGLTNAMRHAQTKRITVRIWADETQLAVQVADEGVGFDQDAALRSTRSGGLQGMRERVRLVGGELLVESVPGRGTRVIAELPIQEPPREPRSGDGTISAGSGCSR